jgi:hypothetical protein
MVMLLYWTVLVFDAAPLHAEVVQVRPGSREVVAQPELGDYAAEMNTRS